MNKYETSKRNTNTPPLSPSIAQQQAGDSKSPNQQKQPPQQQPGNQPKTESQVKQSDSQLNQSNAQKTPQSNKPQSQHQRQQQQQQQQQQQASTTTETIKAKWHQQVGAAKVLWGKLTDDEILQSEGNAEKLSGLVKERYAINREEAQKQVKKFLAECKC